MKSIKIVPVALVLSLVVVTGPFKWAKDMQKLDAHVDQPVARAPRMPDGFVPVKEALIFHNRAAILMRERKFSEAVEELKKSLAVQENPQVRYVLGMTLARAGHRGEAINTLKQVSKGKSDTAKFAKKTMGEIERDPNWGLSDNN